MSALVWTRSLPLMWPRWVSTVLMLMPSRPAICLLELPQITRSKICRSRCDSRSMAWVPTFLSTRARTDHARRRRSHARRQHQLAAADAPDRRDDLRRGLPLARIAAGAGAERLVHDRLGTVRRQDQHPDGRRRAAELARQGDAVAVTEVEVRDDHVGAERDRQRAGGRAVFAFTDDLQIARARARSPARPSFPSGKSTKGPPEAASRFRLLSRLHEVHLGPRRLRAARCRAWFASLTVATATPS